MSTIKKFTVEDLKAWAKTNRGLALAVCKAQAFAECERERVDAYIQPIFETYGFKKDLDILTDQADYMQPIKTPQDLYLTQDPRLTEFYDACDKAHREHGFTGEKGYCPALVAGHKYIEKQNELLEKGSELMGVDMMGTYGETRERGLDLLLGACLKAIV